MKIISNHIKITVQTIMKIISIIWKSQFRQSWKSPFGQMNTARRVSTPAHTTKNAYYHTK
jgi:hypothetical protein